MDSNRQSFESLSVAFTKIPPVKQPYGDGNSVMFDGIVGIANLGFEHVAISMEAQLPKSIAKTLESNKPTTPVNTRTTVLERPSNFDKELLELRNDPMKLGSATLIKPLAPKPPIPLSKPKPVEKGLVVQPPSQNVAKLKQHLVIVDKQSLSLTGRRGENAGWQEYMAQVASLDSKAEAKAVLNRIKSGQRTLLRGISTRISRATIAGETRYTAGFGPLPTHKAAAILCDSLIAAGEASCIVWPPWSLKRKARAGD